MLNSLVLRALSGFMAVNMATAPISTQGTGDVVNPRYYGTYKNYNPSDGKIIIDSSGCKLENFYHEKPLRTHPYVTTSYTQVCSINISKFTVDYTPTQYVYVNANGATKLPARDDPLVVTGEVDERDEPYAPLRRYITAYNFTYWKDL
ncbi:MAG: hypothetical protein HDT42_05750 [Ruminococcaceae bacterium]|nr:hypothetical protein [Oscillospiraceae bacterium]